MGIGDRLLNIMKEEQVGIGELSNRTKIPEQTILEILAGIREPDVTAVCRLAEGLGICVQELKEEEPYFIAVPKETLAKLLVISLMEDREAEELAFRILEKGIVDYGF